MIRHGKFLPYTPPPLSLSTSISYCTNTAILIILVSFLDDYCSFPMCLIVSLWSRSNPDPVEDFYCKCLSLSGDWTCGHHIRGATMCGLINGKPLCDHIMFVLDRMLLMLIAVVQIHIMVAGPNHGHPARAPGIKLYFVHGIFYMLAHPVTARLSTCIPVRRLSHVLSPQSFVLTSGGHKETSSILADQ
jgi:hypothetical protein